MTDKDIINALQCCMSDFCKCNDCYYCECPNACFPELAEDALLLIKRQQKEIDHLKTWLDVQAINRIKAEDVEPVRHGRWIKEHRHRGGFHRYTGLDDMGEQHTITVDERFEYDDLYCSACGKQSADNFLNYCPHCGAKMDLEAFDNG